MEISYMLERRSTSHFDREKIIDDALLHMMRYDTLF